MITRPAALHPSSTPTAVENPCSSTYSDGFDSRAEPQTQGGRHLPVALAPMQNPFRSRSKGRCSPEYQAFELLCTAEVESAAGHLQASQRAWDAFGQYCALQQVALAKILEKPVGPHKQCILARMFAARNDLALASLLYLLPLGLYGHETKFVARRIASHSESAHADHEKQMHVGFVQGRYLGLAQGNQIGGYCAYAFRNGVIHVGNIGDRSVVPEADSLLVGKDWTFAARRPPLSMAALSVDREHFGIVPLFGGFFGRLRCSADTVINGHFRDTAYGARATLADGCDLWLEYGPDARLTRILSPGQKIVDQFGALQQRVQDLEKQVALLNHSGGASAAHFTQPSADAGVAPQPSNLNQDVQRLERMLSAVLTLAPRPRNADDAAALPNLIDL